MSDKNSEMLSILDKLISEVRGWLPDTYGSIDYTTSEVLGSHLQEWLVDLRTIRDNVDAASDKDVWLLKLCGEMCDCYRGQEWVLPIIPEKHYEDCTYRLIATGE